MSYFNTLPSPELRSPSTPIDPSEISFYRHEDSRLRAITKYDSFRPQALACSPPVAASYSESDLHPGTKRCQGLNLDVRSAVSLGAVAGQQGVVLFRLTRPQAPVLLLSHADSGGTVTGLSFQQKASQSLFMAASRGTGILVWDVSGHSLSPLWGRLGVESGSENEITSLSWANSSARGSVGCTWLAATTKSVACLWDLRQSPRSSLFKPALRFGVTRKSSATSLAPNIQVACSDDFECAVLDKAGMLRVFDTRMTERSRTTSGTLFSLSAFRHAAVGMSYFPVTSSKAAHWLTWGLDSPSSDAVVRIWTSCDSIPSEPLVHDEDYWFMDGSPARSSENSASSKAIGGRLVAQCTTPDLACARVCPSPIDHSFVTVGADRRNGEHQGVWHAELWKFEHIPENHEARLLKVVSFRGGAKADTALANIRDLNLGNLCAAELGLVAKQNVSPGDPSPFCLMLCSLTDTGHVATHAIAEASPECKAGSGWESDKAALAGISSPARLYPSEKHAPVADAARGWRTSREATVRPDPRPSLDTREPKVGSIPGPEGLPLPFDMDVPVAYSSAGVADGAVGGVSAILPPVPVQGSSVDEADQAAEHARDAALLMEKIETDRIPCPRLCGASFGSGIGGLTMFNNGEVRKMWKWWEKTDPNRLSTKSTVLWDTSQRGSGDMGAEVTGGVKTLVSRDCPRTLQDINDMTSAAKEAQWGEQDDSDVSSADMRAFSGDLVEDGSEASSESDAGSEDTGDGKKDLYDSHVSDAQRPLVDSASGSRGPPGLDRRMSTELGPSSGVLTPSVLVTRRYDRLSLNNQSIELAKGWNLGKMEAPAADEPDDSVADLNNGDESGSPMVLRQTAPTVRRQYGLPRYRFLVPPTHRHPGIPRTRSDTMLPSLATKSGMASTEVDDERGVHGGEYSVRPNMQESMVFLRKLFTHQQEGGTTFPNLFSPPDSPMLPNSFSDPAMTHYGPSSEISPDRKVEVHATSSPRAQIGVYTLRSQSSGVSTRRAEQLVEMEQACIQNAQVCQSLGETEKQETWELLAKAVESGFCAPSSPFNGWGGIGGGALGVKLVDSILKYYEALGDVQMLSTIVCVLGGRRMTTYQGSDSRWSLLPSGQLQHDKYDKYIRRYGAILYGWGLLTTRAELKKHLVRPPTSVIESTSELSQEGADENRDPVIAHVVSCARCSKVTVVGINFCNTCQDYVFRCVICDNAVRGLFTACDSCGHGGHVSHLKEWFSSHDECPSGCGCTCTFTPNPAEGGVVSPRQNEMGQVDAVLGHNGV